MNSDHQPVEGLGRDLEGRASGKDMEQTGRICYVGKGFLSIVSVLKGKPTLLSPVEFILREYSYRDHLCGDGSTPALCFKENLEVGNADLFLT